MNSRQPRLTPLFVLLFATSATASATNPRAFVLDSGINAVVAVDPQSAKVLATVPLDGHPASMIQVPGSNKLVVFDRGAGKGTQRFGWHPTGKSSMSFIDTAGMKKTSTIDLCWNVDSSVLVARSRLVVECPGYKSQKPGETLPAELVVVDYGTEQEVARLPLKGDAELLVTPDRRTLLTVPAYDWRDMREKPAFGDVQMIDVDTVKVVGTVTVKGMVSSAGISADGDHLYLVDNGGYADNPDKNIPGALMILSIPRRSLLTTIDLGVPYRVMTDETHDLFMVLSDAAPRKGEKPQDGFLHIVKGGKPLSAVRTAHRPHFATQSPDGSRLYVVSPDCVSVVDYPTFANVSRIPLGEEVYVREFAVTENGATGVGAGGYKTAAVVNLREKKLTATLTTGRGSVRFMQALGAGLATYGSMSAAASSGSGSGTYTYNIYRVRPGHTSVALSSDDKFAYILNTGTNDVTIIDLAGARVVSKVPVAGDLTPEIQLMPNGRSVAILGQLFLTMIDTRTNQKVRFGDDDVLKIGGIVGRVKSFRVTPSGTHALIAGTKKVVCLDLTTLTVTARLTDFQEPEFILFEDTDARRDSEAGYSH